MFASGNVPSLRDALREAEEVGYSIRKGPGSELVLEHPLDDKLLTIRGNRKDAPKVLIWRIKKVRQRYQRLREILGL